MIFGKSIVNLFLEKKKQSENMGEVSNFLATSLAPLKSNRILEGKDLKVHYTSIYKIALNIFCIVPRQFLVSVYFAKQGLYF